jgi:hypothetical protein
MDAGRWHLIALPVKPENGRTTWRLYSYGMQVREPRPQVVRAVILSGQCKAHTEIAASGAFPKRADSSAAGWYTKGIWGGREPGPAAPVLHAPALDTPWLRQLLNRIGSSYSCLIGRLDRLANQRTQEPTGLAPTF